MRFDIETPSNQPRKAFLLANVLQFFQEDRYLAWSIASVKIRVLSTRPRHYLRQGQLKVLPVSCLTVPRVKFCPPKKGIASTSRTRTPPLQLLCSSLMQTGGRFCLGRAARQDDETSTRKAAKSTSVDTSCTGRDAGREFKHSFEDFRAKDWGGLERRVQLKIIKIVSCPADKGNPKGFAEVASGGLNRIDLPSD